PESLTDYTMTTSTKIAAIAAILVTVSAGAAGTAFAGDHKMLGLRLGAEARTEARVAHEGLRLGAGADVEARARVMRHRKNHDGNHVFHRLRLKGLGMLESVR